MRRTGEEESVYRSRGEDDRRAELNRERSEMKAGRERMVVCTESNRERCIIEVGS